MMTKFNFFHANDSIMAAFARFPIVFTHLNLVNKYFVLNWFTICKHHRIAKCIYFVITENSSEGFCSYEMEVMSIDAFLYANKQL